MKKIKSKLLQLSIGMSTSILAISGLSIAIVQNTTKRNSKVSSSSSITNDVVYKPLLMHEECLNSNVIVNKASSTSDLGGWGECNCVDKMTALNNADWVKASGETQTTSCNWYTSNASTSGKPMTLNQDNTVTVTSGESTTHGLTWTIQNVGLYDQSSKPKNNAIRVWNEDGHKTSKIVLNNSECGSKLYLLATAANSKNSASQLKVTINYTTGDSVATDFTIMDWGDTPTGEAAKVAAQYNRLAGTAKNGAITSLNVDTSYNYSLCQCELELDNTRIVKDLDLTWNATACPDMVFTVYGVSCAVRDIVVPSTPTCPTTGKVNATLNWSRDESSVVNKYSLDIASDANFTNILTNYNNKLIDKPDSGDTVTFTTGDDLTPNTTYYARIRSVTSDGVQSAASQPLSFTTQEVSVSGVLVNNFKSEAVYGESFDFTSEVTGEKIGGTVYNPKNQKVTHTDVDGLVITDDQSDDKKHTCKCTKCIYDKSVIFTSKLDPSWSISSTITVKPRQVSNVTAPEAKIQDNEFNVAWDSLEEADKYLVTISKNANLSNPISGWNKKSVTETSVDVTELDSGTTYYVGVVAVGNKIEGQSSSVISVKTTGEAPVVEGNTNLYIGLGIGGGLIVTGLAIGIPLIILDKKDKKEEKKNKK